MTIEKRVIKAINNATVLHTITPYTIVTGGNGSHRKIIKKPLPMEEVLRQIEVVLRKHNDKADVTIIVWRQ